MIITFKTKSYGDITMFGDVAIKLIKIMGHGGTVPGAISAEDVPEALEALRKAVEKDKIESAGRGDENAADDDDGERTISLANRAMPLVELFEAAASSNAPVMWE